MTKKNTYLLFLFLSLYLLLSGAELVQKTMYNDGIWYAVIARNLWAGAATFWTPKFTDTIFPVFHEHPPLVFGLQALFFQVLGDTIWTERIFSACTFFATGAFMVLLWRRALAQQPALAQLWALPLVFWILNEVTYHYYASNMLENVLAVFATAAVLAFHVAAVAQRPGQRALLVAAGALSLVLAVLSKGVVGLFPLGFFFLYGVVFLPLRWGAWWRGVVWPTVLAVVLVAAGLYLVTLNPEARQSLQQYIDSQLLASVQGERLQHHFRDNRIYIVRRLIEVLLPGIALLGLLRWGTRRFRASTPVAGLHQQAVLFVLVGLSASLPIAISPKQAVYYLLPAMPFFALAMGLWAADGVHGALTASLQRRPLLWRGMVVGLFVLSLAFAASRINTSHRRDAVLLSDLEKILTVVPPSHTVGSSFYTAHLVGYLYRLSKVNIDTTAATRHTHDFLIRDTGSTPAPDALPPNYHQLPLTTERYHLYGRISQ